MDSVSLSPVSTARARAARSVVEALRRQVERCGPAPAVRYRRDGIWQSLSWNEWYEASRSLAAGLLALGVEPGDHVAILADTRAEWAIADLAIQMTGGVTTPIYASSTAEQVAFILRDCDAKLVFCENAEQLRKVTRHRSELPALRYAHLMVGGVAQGSRPDAGVPTHVLQNGPELTPSWSQLLAWGRAERARRDAALDTISARLTREALATLIYTSGTTGTPKGVRLTHGNLLWSAEAVLGTGVFNAQDEWLLVLPLAHVYGRLCLLVSVMTGAQIALDADLAGFAEQCRAVRPTIFPGVPRLFEKLAAELRGAPPRAVRAALGGRTRLLLTGGAILAHPVAQFFAEAGMPIMEGYGLTECSGLITVTSPGRTPIGSVGRPIGGAEVAIAPDGEILVSSRGIMCGYHRRPEANAEAIDFIAGKAWLHTGDVGRMDEDGYLWLTDRKKDLFKTSGGKYVAPQQIEKLLESRSSLIARAVVCGDGRPYVTALLALDRAELARRARSRREHDRADGEGAPLPLDADALAELQADIDAINARLAPFESIKRFRVLPRELTIDEGELTPSVKLRRHATSAKYRALIEEMYQD